MSLLTKWQDACSGWALRVRRKGDTGPACQVPRDEQASQRCSTWPRSPTGAASSAREVAQQHCPEEAPELSLEG